MWGFTFSSRIILFKLSPNNSKMAEVIQVYQVFLFPNLLFIGQVFATKEEFSILIKKAF